MLYPLGTSSTSWTPTIFQPEDVLDVSTVSMVTIVSNSGDLTVRVCVYMNLGVTSSAIFVISLAVSTGTSFADVVKKGH